MNYDQGMWFDDTVPGKWDEAIKHLRKDKVMREIITRVGPCTLRPRRDYFVKLVQSILSQQVSVKAAASMYAKLSTQFVGKKLKPADVAKFMSDGDEQLIRSCGLSRQKRAYVLDLANKFAAGEIPHKRFGKMTDEEIIEALTAIKGIGRWTAEMLLMFTLNRPDVWPVDDLAIREAVKRNFGMQERPVAKDLIHFADAWRPWRTVASWYLWRSPVAAKPVAIAKVIPRIKVKAVR